MIALLKSLSLLQQVGTVLAVCASVYGGLKWIEYRAVQQERERREQITKDRSDAIDDAISGNCHWTERLRKPC